MKIRVPSAFLLLFIVGLLAAVPIIVKVPCPACEGIGVLTAPKGLEVKGIEYELVDYESFHWGCKLFWIDTTYRVNISVINEAATPNDGYVVVSFHDPDSQGALVRPLFTVLAYIEIPAETAENIERILVYQGFVGTTIEGSEVSYWKPHKIIAEIGGGILCPVCAGKEKLTLPERVKAIVQ